MLNPNLNCGGVYGKQNQFGFVIVAVCGSVFKSGDCVGVFEHVFGLLQDPSSQFRWKIKWNELRVTQATISQMPCISDLPELLAICDN